MKHTKENIIKLLNEMIKVKKAAADECHKRRNITMYRNYMAEIVTLDKVIGIITRKEWFDGMVEIYFDEEDK